MEGFNESGQPEFQGETGEEVEELQATEPETQAAAPKDREYAILRELEDGNLARVGTVTAVNGGKAVDLFKDTLTEEGEYKLRPVVAKTIGGDPYVVKVETPTAPVATVTR